MRDEKRRKRLAVFNKLHGRCSYCGEVIRMKTFNMDHLHPKQLGGGMEFDNLMPSCRSCNIYKGVYSLEQFRRNIELAAASQRDHSSMFRLLERFEIIKQVKTKVVFYFEEASRDTYTPREQR